MYIMVSLGVTAANVGQAFEPERTLATEYIDPSDLRKIATPF